MKRKTADFGRTCAMTWAAVALAALWVLPSNVSGAAYEFRSVVHRFAPRVTPSSINSAGAVAFTARRDDGTSGIYVSSGGPVTTIVEDLNDGSLFEGTFGEAAFGDLPVLNAAGLVAFQGRTRETVGVYTGNGGALSRIAPNGDLIAANSPVLNDAGRIAFITGRSSDDYGYYATTSGGALTRLGSTADGFEYFSRPAINNAGTVAFVAGDTVRGPYGVYTVPASGGAMTRVVGTDGPFRTFGPPAFSDDGGIAFLAKLDDGTFGIYSYADGEVTTIADTSGPFASFGIRVAVNEQGTVVFTPP